MTQTPATPQAGTTGDPQPQAGTTTPSEPQAGDELISLEEARKLRSEANALRKREKEVLAQLKVYQDAEQAKKDAELPELERHKKLVAEQQEQMESLALQVLKSNVRDVVTELAGKFNFVVSAKSLTKFLLQDWDAIEFDDETDMPTNIEKLLEKLAKAEPEIVRQEQQQRAPAIPAGNPGRSNINPPGQQPGKPRRMTEYGRGELFKI